MNDFAAEWLALREPADMAARSSGLTQLLARMLRLDGPLRAVDLAAGTGANQRYLSEYFPAGQHWLLIDRDPSLLAKVAIQRSPMAVVVTREMDLATLEEAGIFAGRALVTASALLDLVSERWMREMANRCCGCRAAALFALSYDGRISFRPEEPEDGAIRELVNRHQRTDKGFGGAALGPDAARYAEQCFASFGYEVRRAPSDWVLPPEMEDLQRELIQGWARAASAIAPSKAPSIRSWQSRRLAHVAEVRSRLTVGHDDLAAWPQPG